MAKEKKTSGVQGHGIDWERSIATKVYGLSDDEYDKIPASSPIDVPAHLNRLKNVNIHIKTSKNSTKNLVANKVDMGSPLKFFEQCGNPEYVVHITVLFYKQADEKTKEMTHIVEFDITNFLEELFGSLSVKDILALENLVKSFPKNTKLMNGSKEKVEMEFLRDELNSLSGALIFHIKVDTKKQRRVQCSLNKFDQLLKDHSERIVAQSSTNEFRGKTIVDKIPSERRVLTKVNL